MRFVARAKQLGCTLDEIAELLRARDGDRCAPVAARLAGLVAAKRAETAASIAELAGFAVQLQDAAATLAGAPRDEPCGDDCSCMAEAPGDPFLAVPVTLGRSQDTEPIACTLDAREWPERVDEWHRLLAGVRTREPVDGDVRLVFDLGVDASEIARLAGAEQDCCRFFAFALTIDARGLALEVRGELHGPGPG